MGALEVYLVGSCIVGSSATVIKSLIECGTLVVNLENNLGAAARSLG